MCVELTVMSRSTYRMENGDKQETKTTSRVSGKFFARGEEQNGVTASFDTLASYLSTSTTFAKAVKCAC